MMHTQTIAQIARALQQGQISCQELTQFFLNRINQWNPPLNALITITEEAALAAAQAIDEKKSKYPSTRLTGIPIAHKDNFCTKGVKTSCASKMLDNFIAPYNATAVERLEHAGAITLGKTNMDEFAMGSSNETSYYGAVKNPWNLTCVPGGSSGGSAAAVAAGLVLAATGTDTGGSIRQPAALCGITGLKPTYGRVSRYGMIAFASSLDQGGLMAKTAEDIAFLLQYMAGFDEKDATSIKVPVPDYYHSLYEPLKGLKIGLPRQYFNVQLDPAIATVTLDAAKILEELGAHLIEISLPHLDYSIPVYYIIASAEASSNLARYDGVRYGYRCQSPKNLTDLYMRSRGEGFGNEVKRRILMGTYALSSGYYDAYYRKAQQVRYLIRQDFVEAFKEVDIILGPTTPGPAFLCNASQVDPIDMYLSDIYTIAVNLAGIPALAMPAGFIKQKPIGVQLIGDFFAEAKLLNVAHQYQQITHWHQQFPTLR